MFTGCGMSLLSEHWLVSAAHCFFEDLFLSPKVDYGQAIAGKYNKTVTSTRQTRDVGRLYIHPLWHANSVVKVRATHDIALAYVDDPFEFNDYVQPIEIAEDIPNTNDTAFVAGYGKTTFKKTSNKLLYLKLNVPDQAKMRYDVAYKSSVDESIFCIGEKRRISSPGSGDSGGPVWVYANDVPKLVGAVSFDAKYQSRRKAYTCNNAVPRMKSWIEETMKRDYIRLNVTESPQEFSWNNDRKSYQNEFIKLSCLTENCKIQIKHIDWNFGRSENGCKYSRIKMNEYTILPSDSAPELYSGRKFETTEVKLSIFGTRTPNQLQSLKFTYQVYNETFETVTCKGPEYKCDGVMDCMDQEDESDCEYNSTIAKEVFNIFTIGCFPFDYKCKDSTKCVRPSRVGDFSRDCPSMDDEWRVGVESKDVKIEADSKLGRDINGEKRKKIDVAHLLNYTTDFFSGTRGVRSSYCLGVFYVGVMFLVRVLQM